MLRKPRNESGIYDERNDIVVERDDISSDESENVLVEIDDIPTDDEDIQQEE